MYMFKRYFYTVLGILSLLGIYYLSLFPILVIRTKLESNHFILAIAVWGFIAAVFFIPAIAIILKKAWFFKGKGEPIVLDLLQTIILSVNKTESPVEVKKHRKKLIVTWKYTDQVWCERLEKSGMKRMYELWLTFDNNTKTVSMSDRYRSANWELSPIAIKTGWLAATKPFFKVETGKEWGVENYEDTLPDDYSYTPNEIKSPVMNSILKNGWNVRFTLF